MFKRAPPKALVSLRLSAPLAHAIDACAHRAGHTRSEAARELMCSELERRGLWPPAAPTCE